MVIERTINKEEIRDLPKAVYAGRIYVIQTISEADKAVMIRDGNVSNTTFNL